jgi:hypothetical protein
MAAQDNAKGQIEINPDQVIARIDDLVGQLTCNIEALTPVIKSDIPAAANVHFASALIRSVLLPNDLEMIISLFEKPLRDHPIYSDYGYPDYSGKIAPSLPESIGNLPFFQPFAYEFPEDFRDFDDFEFNSLQCGALTKLITAAKENRIHINAVNRQNTSALQTKSRLNLSPLEVLDVATTVFETILIVRGLWEHEKTIQDAELEIDEEYEADLRSDEVVMERLYEDHLYVMDEWLADMEEGERLRLHDSGYDEESFWEQESYVDWEEQ